MLDYLNIIILMIIILINYILLIGSSLGPRTTHLNKNDNIYIYIFFFFILRISPIMFYLNKIYLYYSVLEFTMRFVLISALAWQHANFIELFSHVVNL